MQGQEDRLGTPNKPAHVALSCDPYHPLGLALALGIAQLLSSPVSGEGGKLAAILADLQGLGTSLSLGQGKQVGVQLHGEGDLVLGKCVVRARPVLYHT